MMKSFVAKIIEIHLILNNMASKKYFNSLSVNSN